MEQKPNVLIIQTDQQAKWTLGCYGGELIDTPHIDSIAKEGVRFDNFFTVSAVCTPSRGCFVTGQYPHFNGAYRNDVPINQDATTFAHILSQNGYATTYIGKWHLNGGYRPGWMSKEHSMGFEDCEYMFNCGHYKNVIEQKNANPIMNKEIGDEKTYMTDWLVDKAIEKLRTRSKEPFCMMISIPDPHQPFKVRAPYNTMYKPEDMTIPKSFYQHKLPDWADLDEWGRNRYFPMEEEGREDRLRKIKAQYCGEVKCIDDNVGKLLSYLEQEKILDDTILVFVTDHGEYMGEHGLLEKNNLFESVYNIPLAIRWPRKIKASTVVKPFVSIVDFQQTLLGLMEIKPCGKEQGRNAAPLIMGEDISWENEIFIHPNDVPRTGIFTDQYELAYVGSGWNREDKEDFKDHILFDRRNDKDQINNLFSDNTYDEVVESLTKKIVDHHKKLGMDPSVLPKVVAEKM